MANNKQAKKRIRQDAKRTERNDSKRRNISYLLRQVKKAIESSDKEKATELFTKYQKAVDKATKTFLHKNTASRRKSRLMKKINAIIKA